MKEQENLPVSECSDREITVLETSPDKTVDSESAEAPHAPLTEELPADEGGSDVSAEADAVCETARTSLEEDAVQVSDVSECEDGAPEMQKPLETAEATETAEIAETAETALPADADLTEEPDLQPAEAVPLSEASAKAGTTPSDSTKTRGLVVVLTAKHFIVAAVVMAVVIAGGILFGMLIQSGRLFGDPDIEPNIKDYQDIYANAGDVAAGNFSAPGYSDVSFPAGKETVQMVLPNPVGNPCYLRFSLVLTDTGEVLYSSKLIPPGKAVTQIKLNRPLERGTYNMEIQIGALSLDKNTELNGVNMKTVLTVR